MQARSQTAAFLRGVSPGAPRLRETPESPAHRPSPSRGTRPDGTWCRSVTTEAGFLELQPVWTDLCANLQRTSPFQSWDFALEWWRHFVRGRAGRATGVFEVIVAYDRTSRAIGIVPLYEEHGPGGPALGQRLQPFGRSYSFEAMTDEPISLFRSGQECAAIEAVTEYLARRAPEQGWDVAVVRGVHDTTHASKPRAQRRSFEIVRPAATAMPLRLPRSWQLFWSGLSKSMRDNLAYYPKRLDRELGGWRIWTARTPAEVAMATEALIALHRKRSESSVGKPHCSHIPTQLHASFMRRWFQRLAARDRISLVVMESLDGIRAVQAFVEAPNLVSVYYSGYDEEVAPFSALTLITAARIRQAVADGTARIEFPPDSSPWSTRWGARVGSVIPETSVYTISAGAMLRGVGRRCKMALSSP